MNWLMDRAHKLGERDYRPLAETYRRRDRLPLFANSGGVVATLSLIGTILGAGHNQVPRTVFWVLVFFLVGLILAWGCRIAEVFIAERPNPQNIWRARVGLVVLGRTVMFWLSMLVFVVAAATGLVELYALTE